MRLVLLIACVSAFAQTPRPPPNSEPVAAPTKWPVQAILVEGNKVFTREQIAAASGLKIGQPAGKPDFEAARDRLVATGVFETVGYRFEPGPDNQGFVATFQ